jgi:hypothetical protein
MECSNASGTFAMESQIRQKVICNATVLHPQISGTIPHDSAAWTAYAPRTIPSLHPIAENHHASLNAGPTGQCPRNPQSLSMSDLTSYQYSYPSWLWRGMRTRRTGPGRPWPFWWVGVRAFVRPRKRRLFPQLDHHRSSRRIPHRDPAITCNFLQ